MNKKGIYILYNDISDTTGVNKKIKSQIKTFRKAGFDMDVLIMDTKYVVGWKILYRLPFTNILPNWHWDDKFKDCDFIYLRKPWVMSFAFLRLLKKIRRNNQNVKVIMEIPTYPYIEEFKSRLFDIPQYVKEIVVAKYISIFNERNIYINRIALLEPEKFVYGINTIQFNNGYDFDNAPEYYEKETDVVNIAAVAMFSFWHGYDRLLKGLRLYYDNGGKRKYIIHFVGDGKELDDYKTLCLKLSLNDKVKFYGLKGKDFLSDLYSECHFGCCCLGLYRKKLTRSKELKSREYLNAGLPLITVKELDVCEDPVLAKYTVEFPNNSSPIDFNLIDDAYVKYYHQKTADDIFQMRKDIHIEAKKRYNWDESMREIIQYVRL